MAATLRDDRIHHCSLALRISPEHVDALGSLDLVAGVDVDESDQIITGAEAADVFGNSSG